MQATGSYKGFEEQREMVTSGSGESRALVVTDAHKVQVSRCSEVVQKCTYGLHCHSWALYLASSCLLVQGCPLRPPQGVEGRTARVVRGCRCQREKDMVHPGLPAS